MMSIVSTGAGAALFAVAPTVGPTVAPTTVPAVPTPGEGGQAWVYLLLAGWAVAGLGAAWRMGAFRRQGIVGPERLAADESAWPILGALGAGVLGAVVGAVVAGAAVGVARGARVAHPSADVTLLVGSAASDVAAAVIVVAILWGRRADGSGLRLAGLNPRGLPVAVAGGTAALFVLLPLVLLASAAVEAAYRALHLTKAPQHPMLEMLGPTRHPAVVAAALFTAVVIAPATEELLFRGLLQTTLGRLFTWAGRVVGFSPMPPVVADVAAEPGVAPFPLSYAAPPPPVARWPHTPPAARWAAVAVTSVAFAAIHYPSEPAAVGPIFVLSLGLGFVYERSGNLYMNAVTHGLFNAAEIALYLAVGGGA